MQVKNSFDQESIKKVAKGAAIAGTGAAALYILNWMGAIETGMFAPLVAALVPIAVNAIKEWMKGENVVTE